LVILLPFYIISKWILIAQGIIALYLISTGFKLFSTWDDKKAKIAILLGKNKDEFRPDSFEVFVQAPCGRLVVKTVLAELGKPHEYRNLLKLKKPFFEAIKESCTPTKAVIYINEEALSEAFPKSS
jgi:hypothetical protein